MIWLLAALMQLSPLMIVTTELNDLGTKLVLRNTSDKVITAFRIKQKLGIHRSRELVKGIEPGAIYEYQLPGDAEPEVTGIVFADGSYQGQGARIILARREGVRTADDQISHRARQFNSLVPAKWTTNEEKAAYTEGYERRMEESNDGSWREVV